jgi:hypothetical protein
LTGSVFLRIFTLETHFAQQRIDYTGEQLRSHWVRKEFGIEGDCIVSFIGACDVKPEFMVDLVDRQSGSRIYSPLMLHFIIEHFDSDLEKGILRQRLLAAIAAEYLSSASDRSIVRQGDDIYLDKRKFSVSIATASPVSLLIHFGINILTKDVPVPAAGLDELGLEADVTAHHISRAYVDEIVSISKARTSAMWVK